jgi:hypothetical protein
MYLGTEEEDLIRQWAPHLLNLMMHAGQMKDHDSPEMMLGRQGQYHVPPPRPLLPWRIPLDEVGAIDELVHLADDIDLTDTARFLQDQFELPAPSAVVLLCIAVAGAAALSSFPSH